MRMNRRMVYGILLAAAAGAGAQEKKLNKEQLPAAVQVTIARETQGASIRGYATEREHGRKVYEAETTIHGHTRDIQVAEDGTLNEVEEEVAFDSLPAEVQAALKARAKEAKIAKVESLTKKAALVAYEASTLKGTQKGEVQVGPKGQALAHEE